MTTLQGLIHILFSGAQWHKVIFSNTVLKYNKFVIHTSTAIVTGYFSDVILNKINMISL